MVAVVALRKVFEEKTLSAVIPDASADRYTTPVRSGTRVKLTFDQLLASVTTEVNNWRTGQKLTPYSDGSVKTHVLDKLAQAAGRRESSDAFLYVEKALASVDAKDDAAWRGFLEGPSPTKENAAPQQPRSTGGSTTPVGLRLRSALDAPSGASEAAGQPGTC